MIGAREGKLVAGCSAGMGLVLLLVLAGIFTMTFHEVYEAQSWHEAACEILSARSQRDRSAEHDDWEVKVSWSYRVADVEYQRIDADPAVFGVARGLEEAERVVARYRPGGTVPCFYDPADPRISALDRSAPPAEAIVSAVVVAALLLAIAAALVAAVVRRRRAG